MLEQTLFTILGPLVGNRVFPDTAPFTTPKPYITYQQVGGDLIKPLGKSVPDKQNALVQINVWEDTRVKAKELALDIEDAIRTSELFNGQPDSGIIATNEPDLKLYGTRQDFSIWYSRD